MGGGTNLVFFLSVLGFGAPSHTELVLQYGSLVPKETVCESPELRHAQGARALCRKFSFFSFFLTAHPCNLFQFLLWVLVFFCYLQFMFCFMVKVA